MRPPLKKDMALPEDPMMLYSFVNTKLRDEYPTLKELCKSEGVDEARLRERLGEAGFEYNTEQNKFW